MEQPLGTLNGHVQKPTTVAEKIVRLDCMDSAAWQLFPRFIERCVLFAKNLLSYTDMQLRNMEQDLRNKWATPNGALFMAVLDGRGEMVGHLLGWVNVDYGQPYLFNFQVEVDDGFNLMPIVDQALVDHIEYVQWANAMYEKGGQQVRINQIVTQTMRNGEALIRYLRMKGVTAVAERTVIKWSL